jgi:predicted GNAT family acetyltransferase
MTEPAETLPIVREDGARAGRYVVRFADGAEAEMTYRRRGPGLLDIEHTFVPPEHREAGLALRLVAAGIADARREGVRIIPSCPYVAAQFRRHPGWADLLGER